VSEQRNRRRIAKTKREEEMEIVREKRRRSQRNEELRVTR
jgi:hypothetical protein